MTGPGVAGVTGVILAGGLSRRMGGGDKGLLSLSDRPMLAHVIERLRPQVSALVINANGDAERLASFGLPVVADTVEGFAGPLAGVLAGMRWSQANTPAASHVVTATTDAPLLPRDLVARLQEATVMQAAGIALAQSCGKLHPAIGLWPVTLADDLERDLVQGMRKVMHWVEKQGFLPVPFEMVRGGEREVDPFYNANTAEDLDTLRSILAETRP